MHSTDKRWKDLGEVLIHYCLDTQPGEKVLIAQYEIETWPLALATYEAAIKAGAISADSAQIRKPAPGVHEIRHGRTIQLGTGDGDQGHGMGG